MWNTFMGFVTGDGSMKRILPGDPLRAKNAAALSIKIPIER